MEVHPRARALSGITEIPDPWTRAGNRTLPASRSFALLGVVGPMAGTVRDVELLFDVVAGRTMESECRSRQSAPPVRLFKTFAWVICRRRTRSVTKETRRFNRLPRFFAAMASPWSPFFLKDSAKRSFVARVLFIDGVSMLLRAIRTARRRCIPSSAAFSKCLKSAPHSGWFSENSFWPGCCAVAIP